MNNMQLWLISSTDSINLNSAADGYYLNPDLDGLTGLPGIRSSNGVNAGYDGGWTSTQLWDARLITIRGLIVDKDGSQVELKRKALSKLVGQGKKKPLTLKFVTEFGRTYTCTVRTTNCTMALQNIFTRQEYQIQLRADDPLIYDDGGNDVKATLRVTEDNVGFEIPFDIPLDISGGADPVVVDAGEDTNYPLITMYGELHSPTIVNQTTNQQLQLGADLNGLTRDWNETDTASGNSFQITNSTEYDAPIQDFKLNGNTEQTTYSGKNLCYKTTYSSYAQNLFFIPKSTKDYSVSVISNENLSNNSVYLFINGTGVGRVGYITGTAGQKATSSFTVSDEQYTSLLSATEAYLQIYKSTASFTEPQQPQIEAGLTPTDYQEFCGGIPSPNPDYPQAVNVVTGEQTVKVEGKNLLPTITGSDTYSGVSLTSTNGTITATGTASANMTFTLTGTDGIKYRQAYWQTILATTTNSVLIPKGTYYFSGSATLGNITIQYRLVDIGQKLEDGTSISLNSSITLTKDKWLCIAIYVNNTRTPDVNMSALQLELGNQATTYEAYRGTDYEVNLGKNLFYIVPDSINGVALSYASDGAIVLNGKTTASTTVFEAVVDYNGKYTLSCKNAVAQGNTYVRTRDGNNTLVQSFLLDTTTDKTQTSTSQISKLEIRINAIDVEFDNFKIYVQLEKGTQTSFVPYFTPIELCKIGTYQDYIWNDNGTWKVHKAVGKVDLGSLTYTGGTVNQGYIYSTTGITGIKYVSSNTELGAIISTDYTLHTASGMWDTHGFIAVDTAKVAITNKTASPTGTAYYALATATDTTITESALITQLNAIVQASLPVGLNNVSNISIAPNLAGDMVLTYGTGYIETPPDVAVIDCKDRTVSINGVNAFNLLADGSEFIRLEPGENKLYLTSETQSDSGYAEVKFKTGNLSI